MTAWSDMGGDDRLVGGDGSDTIRGGAGNDTLVIDELDLWLQGGKGEDTAIFKGDGSFNLSKGFFHSIENFDMDNDETNTLRLDFGDLRAAGGEFTVYGDEDDQLILNTQFGRVGDNYTTDTVTIDGETFVRYKAEKGTWLDVELYVDEDIQVQII